MDAFKRKRKKTDSQKKVLLSIVDPWDVSLASVDPVGLAERRGVSLSILPPRQNGNTAQEHLSPGRTVRIPSPWYKPAYISHLEHSSVPRTAESRSPEPTWVDPWHSSSRSPVAAQPSSAETPQKLTKKKGQQSEARNSRRSYDLRNVQTIPDDNGLIGATQEITRDDLDHDHRTGAVARVRFESEERPRSSTWGSPLEVDRLDEKGHLYQSRTIQLPGASPLACNSPTREKDKRTRRSVESSVVENDSKETDREKCSKPTKETEIVSRGSFEDKELVNVVQNLVTARYSPILPGTHRRISRRSPCGRRESPKEMDTVDCSKAVGHNEDIAESRKAVPPVKDETRERFLRPETTTGLGATSIRKTSVSMPSNLDAMEDLRIVRHKVSQSSSVEALSLKRRKELYQGKKFYFEPPKN